MQVHANKTNNDKNKTEVDIADNKQLIRWFNCPLNQLKIIIGKTGMTTYLCHGTQIIVVDPT